MDDDPHRLGSIAMKDRPTRLDEPNASVLKRLAIRRHQGRRIFLPLASPSFETIAKFLQSDAREHPEGRIREFIAAAAAAPKRRGSEAGGRYRRLIERVMYDPRPGKWKRTRTFYRLPGRCFACRGQRKILIASESIFRIPLVLAAANQPENPRSTTTEHQPPPPLRSASMTVA